MMFSNSISRPLAFSKIGDLFSSGFTRVDISGVPSGSTRVIDGPKLEGGSGSKPGAGNQAYDQHLVDAHVNGFSAPGHASGTRTPGESPDTPDTPEMADYHAKHQKEWQVQKDAGMRDKLFAQPTPGRVEGQEVEPFSARGLEENAAELVQASSAKADRALPLQRKDIAKVASITAVVTVPLSTVGVVASGAILEVVKPLISSTKTAATEQSVQDGRLVDHSQKSVFLLANTLADLRSEPHVQPGLEWVAKTNEERMDYLEEMLDYIEPAFANEAQKLGISFQAASTGAEKDDIKSRALGLESRMAALTALMGAMKVKHRDNAA